MRLQHGLISIAATSVQMFQDVSLSGLNLLIIVHLDYIVNRQAMCPICKQKFIEHSELQDKICKMITIKQFANNCPGFDVQFRPFFED
jgi:hypothetical protein